MNDIIKCPICKDVMTDPRMLPCNHTYCFKCLESSENSHPGATIPCHVCSSEFTVPLDGVKSIPQNLFIAKTCAAILTEKESVVAKSFCVLCEANELKCEAIFYCDQCEQPFCRRCANSHSKLKVAKDHTLTEMSNLLENMSIYRNDDNELCMVHSGRYLDVYCESCNRVICMLCYTTNHSRHKINDVKSVSQTLKDKLRSNYLAIKDKQLDYELQIKVLKELENKCISNINSISENIANRSSVLKQIISENSIILKDNINDYKMQELSRISDATRELKNKQNILNSYIKNVDELINQSSDAILIEGFDDVDKKCRNLNVDNDLPFKEIFFDHFYCDSDSSAERFANHFLGEIIKVEEKALSSKYNGCDTCDRAVFINHFIEINQLKDNVSDEENIEMLLIKADKVVTMPKEAISVAVSNNLIFVIFKECQVVEIYSLDSGVPTGKILITDMSDPRDLSVVDFFLFLCENDCGWLHRVHLENFNCIKWHCGFDNIDKISTTLDGNILVLSQNLKKIVEYSVDGTKLLDVPLTSDIEEILDCCHIGQGQLLVFYRRNVIFNIAVLSADGNKLASFVNYSNFELKNSKILTFKINGSNYCLIFDLERRYFLVFDSYLNYVNKLKSLEGENSKVFDWLMQNPRFSYFHNFKVALGNDRTVCLFNSANNILLVIQLYLDI